MSIPKNKITKKLIYFLLFIFFLKLIFSTLSVGGRWDLNEQIAFANRLMNGFSCYANGIDDLFFPSSPYFPGVGYISYFFQITGFDNLYINNRIMLITAVLIGLTYVILLHKLTRVLYPEINKNIILIIITIIYTTHFRDYISYMQEFKPDTILLVISTYIFLLLEVNNKVVNYYKFIVIGILLFLVVFFKQSSFITYIYVFFLIGINNFLNLKQKILLIIFYTIIGLIALYIIFNIDNAFYFTIVAMSQHPFLNVSSILYYFLKGILSNFIFICGLLYFIINNYKCFSISKIETKYFIFSLMWFTFSAISTAKLGGNTGNVEVGLIVFFPFVVYALNELLNTYKSIYKSINLILFSLIVMYSILAVKHFNRMHKKI